jgi:hypothetical protein
LLRVEGVVEAIAEQVEAHDDGNDGEMGSIG